MNYGESFKCWANKSISLDEFPGRSKMPRNSEIGNHIKIGSVLMALSRCTSQKNPQARWRFYGKFIQLLESEVLSTESDGPIELEAQNSKSSLSSHHRKLVFSMSPEWESSLILGSSNRGALCTVQLHSDHWRSGGWSGAGGTAVGLGWSQVLALNLVVAPNWSDGFWKWFVNSLNHDYI